MSVFEISRQEFDDLYLLTSVPSTWPRDQECASFTNTAGAVFGVVICTPATKRWSYVLLVREVDNQVREAGRCDGLLSVGAAKRDLLHAMQVYDGSPVASSWGSG